jgi:TPR repeat protein
LRAEQGDAEAEYNLSKMYHRGSGVPRDYAAALRWLRKASDQGNAKANYGIGSMYYYGEGVPSDKAEAVRWYRKAADQGEPMAQDALGSMYYYGSGVPQDYAEAIRWYRKAADQGEANARDTLGTMYFYGRGMPQDYGEAIRWYRQAANQGLGKAEYDLGFMYNHGYGVPQDRAEALRWFRKAAGHGDLYAQRALGRCFGLTKIDLVFLSIRVVAGLFFLIYFLLNRKKLRSFRERIPAFVGVLCFFTAGMSWYGYSHYLIGRFPFGFGAFSLFKWFLDGVFFVLLVSILLPGKKSGGQPGEITTPAKSAGGGGVLGL